MVIEKKLPIRSRPTYVSSPLEKSGIFTCHVDNEQFHEPVMKSGNHRNLKKDYIDNEKEKFSEFLKERGQKITHQRLMVAEKIFSLESHFTIDSLTDMFKDRRDEISRATIYRIVSLLVESEQLTEHNFGGGVNYYEHIPSRKHHDHIVCMDCGLIEEFMNTKIETIQEDIAREQGFLLNEHRMTLYGHCMELKKTGKCSRQKQAPETRMR